MQCMSRQSNAPVTVVASGELMVVHQNMHRFSRNAWEAESSRKSCRQHNTPSTSAAHSLLHARNLLRRCSMTPEHTVSLSRMPTCSSHLEAALMDLGIVRNIPDFIGRGEHEARHDRQREHVVVEQQRRLRKACAHRMMASVQTKCSSGPEASVQGKCCSYRFQKYGFIDIDRLTKV